MKYILSILLILTTLVGCGKKEEKTQENKKVDKYAFDSTAIKAAPVENPNQEFTLKYNFQKGNTYKYRLTTITRSKQTVKTDTLMTQIMNQKIVYLIDLKVNEIDKDGVIELNCNMNSIKMNADAGGESFSYQSDSPTDSTDKVKFAEYEALINNPFVIRVTSDGIINEFSRVDRVVNKFLELKGVADSATADQKLEIKNQMVEGALRPLLTQIIREFPDKKLGKDSSWTHEQAPSRMLVFQIQNTNTYHITNLQKYNNDLLADIDAGLKTKISGNTHLNNRGVIYDFEKPKTTATGEIYFNVSKGYIQKSKTHTSVDFAFNMEAKTQRGTQKGHKAQDQQSTNIVEFISE